MVYYSLVSCNIGKIYIQEQHKGEVMNHTEPDPILIQHHFKDGDLEGLVIGNIGNGQQGVIVEETSDSGNARTSVKTSLYARLVSRKTGQELAEVVSAVAQSLERETGEKPRVWARIMKKGIPLADWYNPFVEKEFYREMQGERTTITQCNVRMETEKAQAVMRYTDLPGFTAGTAGISGSVAIYAILTGMEVAFVVNSLVILSALRNAGAANGMIQITYRDPALRDWAETAVKSFYPTQLKRLSAVTGTDKPYKPATS